MHAFVEYQYKTLGGLKNSYVLHTYGRLRSNLGQGGEPSVKLAPGQETSVQVSFGRKDNVVGNITVGQRG